MEVGLRIRYGRLIVGREQQASDLFATAMNFFGKKKAEGLITYFEPFFISTSDLEEEFGFFILRGPAPELLKLVDEEEYKILLTKAMHLVEHVKVDWLVVGSGIQEAIDRGMKVRAELGI